MCNAFLVSNYKDEQSDNKLFITCYGHLKVNGSETCDINENEQHL